MNDGPSPTGPPSALRPGVTTPPGGANSPSTFRPGVVPPPPVAIGLDPARSKSPYVTGAVSPLWLMVAALVSSILLFGVALVTAVSWSDLETDSDGVVSGVGLVSLLLLAITSAVLSLMWLRQIGKNAGLYGLVLVMVASLPMQQVAWGAMSGDDLAVLQARSLIGLVVIAIFLIVPYRIFVTKVWMAGPLPVPVLTYALWVPRLGASLLLGAANISRFFGAEEFSNGAFEGWRADPISDGVLLTVAAVEIGSAVALLGVAIAVTVVQHVAITRERRARRERSALVV